MRFKEEKKHYILKSMVILIVLVLGFIIWGDFTPEVQTLHRDIANAVSAR